MGSYRGKQRSYVEILKAIQVGALQGLTRNDRLLASQIWNTLNKLEYDADLKLYLPFDEASGVTAHDLSGNGNTGTATGTTIVDGVFGKARNFDGIDDYVKISDVDFPGSSFAFAVRRDIDGGTIYAYIADGWRLVDSGNAIDLDVWYHYVFVSDNTNNKSYAYLNGVKIAEVAYILGNTSSYEVWALSSASSTADRERLFNRNSATDFRIGTYGSFDNSWNGLIDEPRIYSRALTADEIYLHYLAGALKLGLI